MKNLLKISLAAMLLLTLPAAANAQFGNFGKKLKEKAKQKVEQKVNQTIRKEREKESCRQSERDNRG